MITYDYENIVHQLENDKIMESISEVKVAELVKVYKALTECIDTILSCEDWLYITYTLSEFQYLIALELINRALYEHEDIRTLLVPCDKKPDYILLEK